MKRGGELAKAAWTAAVVMAIALSAQAAPPDHPIITEVYHDPNGTNDGPVGRDPNNPHQEFVEIYLPTQSELNQDIDANSLNLTLYTVEGDHSSSGLGLVNYRWDLPTFCLLDNANDCPPNTIARPPSGLVVIGWVDYVGDPPTGLAGSPGARLGLINGGIVSAPGDYVFVAMNGHHFQANAPPAGGGTTNFDILDDESFIDFTCGKGESCEVQSGIVQNGSEVYILVDRDHPKYVELFDDKHVPKGGSADPDLPNGGVLLPDIMFDALAANDDLDFVVEEQPLPECEAEPADCVDLQTVLPEGGVFSELVPQIPELDKTEPAPGTANGYARVFVDVAKTTEDNAIDDDPVEDALNAYRHVRNVGPFFATPGQAALTTSPPQLSVADDSEQMFEVLTETVGRPGLLTANVGGNTAIDIAASGGTSSDPTVATFAAGIPDTNVGGQSFGFPSVAVAVAATASHGDVATAEVNITASTSTDGLVVMPAVTSTITATILKPTAGMDANGQPFQTTVFVAIQGIVFDPSVTNEFRATDLGAFLAAQPDISALETYGNGSVLIDPATDIADTDAMKAMVQEFPDFCCEFLNPSGATGDLLSTVLTSADHVVNDTYVDAIGTCECPKGPQTAVKAINGNHPDTRTFGGSFSPSELVHFTNDKGRAGLLPSGLTYATTSRTFELAIIDTTVTLSGIETGATDDFGIVIEVLETEAGASVVPGEFVFLSFTGSFEGADIDSLAVPPGNLIATAILLDLDNLHTHLGIRSIERVILVDGTGNGEVDVIEIFSLNPIGGAGCTDKAECNDNIPCTLDECSGGLCVNTPNDALCLDLTFCDGEEICSPVVGCQEGTPVDCDDGVDCTLDFCNEFAEVCIHITDDAACDNLDFCDGTEVCDEHLGCLNGSNPCTDENFPFCDEINDECDECELASDCADTSFCNGAEICDATGACQSGTPVDCDDGVDCTQDSCNEVIEDCINITDNTVCDNSAFCDGMEVCDELLGCLAGSAPCTEKNFPFCDEINDECDECELASDCADTSFCNGAEICDATGECQSGTPVDCDDGVDCTQDSCNDVIEDCINITDNTLCDNSTFCDGTEVCDELLGCLDGSAPCTEKNLPFCDEINEECDECQTAGDCLDTLFCNGTETCDATGSCQTGTGPCTNPDLPICDEDQDQCRECLEQTHCDDANECTSDTCESFACVNDPLPDGTSCSGSGTCEGGECTGVECLTQLECADDDSCTCDGCDEGACTHTPTTFGNVNCDLGDVVDLDDILCVLNGFNAFENCSNADIAPCGGNGIIDLDDILAVIGAFAGADPCCGG